MTSRSKSALKKPAPSKPALRKPSTRKSAAKKSIVKAKPSKSSLAKSSLAKSSLAKSSPAKPASKTGRLPEWNLADLYSGIDAPEVARDLERMDADCVAFETDYKGKLATGTANEDGGKWLAEAVRRYEAIDDLAGRLGSYAGLVHAGDSVDPKISKFYGDVSERLTASSCPGWATSGGAWRPCGPSTWTRLRSTPSPAAGPSWVSAWACRCSSMAVTRALAYAVLVSSPAPCAGCPRR